MKKLFLLMTVCSILLMSCEKDGGLPSLPDPDDVCSAMDDLNFMKYCYENFDVNNDGKVSPFEANAVKDINVQSKGVKSLKGIQYFTNLTSLDCRKNFLKELDVSKNTKLTYLNCDYNELTSLDVSMNIELNKLWCNENALSSLDVSKNTKLSELYCGMNKITVLDVSENKELSELYCSNNSLTSLDISKNIKLTLLGCAYNNLSKQTLNSLFNNLPNTEGKIDVLANPGDEECDKSIYQNKGWKGFIWLLVK